MDAKVVPVTALRPRLLKYVSRASRLGEDFIVTKNGKPSAVLMAFDRWEEWKETIEILSDPKLVRRIRRGVAYFRRGGKGKSIAEAFS